MSTDRRHSTGSEILIFFRLSVFGQTQRSADSLSCPSGQAELRISPWILLPKITNAGTLDGGALVDSLVCRIILDGLNGITRCTLVKL